MFQPCVDLKNIVVSVPSGKQIQKRHRETVGTPLLSMNLFMKKDVATHIFIGEVTSTDAGPPSAKSPPRKTLKDPEPAMLFNASSAPHKPPNPAHNSGISVTEPG